MLHGLTNVELNKAWMSVKSSTCITSQGAQFLVLFVDVIAHGGRAGNCLAERFVISDDATLISGSLNWTHAAVERGATAARCGMCLQLQPKSLDLMGLAVAWLSGNENVVISRRAPVCLRMPQGLHDSSRMFRRSALCRRFALEPEPQVVL